MTIKEQFKPACTRASFTTDNQEENIFQRSLNDEKVGLSADDREFLKIMDHDMKKGENGNWEAPLPFRSSRPNLPNNRSQALKRALILQTSLKKNPAKQQHFVSFMEKIINSGAAEIAPDKPEGECWYLPIFGVYNKKKPNEIRGVFDSSVVFEGQSLNKALLSGPNLANNLLGVLLRFRMGQYAMTADIERMFYSFYVRSDHRDYLRFFWYANNDPNSDLIEYRMRVHVFGNTPSPAVATYGLRKTVEKSDTDVKDYVTKNFYVDDALISLPSADEAIDLMKRTQKDLMTGANIRLHKIASNMKEIMDAFPAEDLAKNLRSKNLEFDDLPMQHSLGIVWDLASDSFTINLSLEDKPFTKRGLLSTINSIFDPMGFVAPVVIRGRTLLREIMTEGLTWDEPLPQDRKLEWESWKDSLSTLKYLKVPRMFTLVSLTSDTRHEVHIFSDASEKAISAVAYLRIWDCQNKPHIGFIMGKSKLAPTNGHTIPRLELCAAVLATDIGDKVIEQLGIDRSELTYHTDSKVVLGYINKKSRRFYTYVSNRVATIHKRSSPEQWNYVQTHLNPADDGTRDIVTAESLATSRWLFGPEHLKDTKSEKTNETSQFPLIEERTDRELRPEISTKKTAVRDSLATKFDRYGSWRGLVDSLSYLKRCIAMKKGNDIDPSIRDIQSRKDTEDTIIRITQQHYFDTEMECLRRDKPISRSSSILSLNPTVDGDGILRVGGRLNKSNLPLESKNPILVPGKSHIAELLVRHYHGKAKHQGRFLTEGAIRSAGYWIIGAKRLVSSIVKKCVICKVLRGSPQHQIMADLPEVRVTPAPPFSSVGVDIFGPWSVIARKTRGGQAESKRWAILFTCLYTRAVHIELVEEMSTSAFINALRRFISLRGSVKEFRSDRGTNFVGSIDVLNVDGLFVEQTEVRDFLYESGTIWKFNPPHASHMGGSWERMIGLSRKILDAMLLQSKQLTHDILATFMAEVCAIINSRPITNISSDTDDPMIVSPTMLITQKCGSDPLPNMSTSIKDIYKASWKHVQYLADVFWKKWKDGYLNTLQKRTKWPYSRPDIKEGDIVLVCDKDLPRIQWPKAKVVKAFPSSTNKRIRTVELTMFKNGKETKCVRPINEVIVLLD
ncbi:hypothetical protein FSP39_009290 [Pinctada imbricata]|uniref:Integrase catalytic domain-containing protein n=1 Tax=Pinctada imbricata TaxID=66713 RepID=A0AA88XGU5_PINIB|nr:hypothetical protein FSP39_009290 [Pinctada imbricata]